MTNEQQLISIMCEHSLIRQEIAVILKVSKSTVNSWLRKGKAHKAMPDNLLDLLHLKLKRD
jgi:DNA-binding transcriptional regulator YiaG